jgi:hypothetical protein
MLSDALLHLGAVLEGGAHAGGGVEGLMELANPALFLHIPQHINASTSQGNCCIPNGVIATMKIIVPIRPILT